MYSRSWVPLWRVSVGGWRRERAITICMLGRKAHLKRWGQWEMEEVDVLIEPQGHGYVCAWAATKGHDLVHCPDAAVEGYIDVWGSFFHQGPSGCLSSRPLTHVHVRSKGFAPIGSVLMQNSCSTPPMTMVTSGPYCCWGPCLSPLPCRGSEFMSMAPIVIQDHAEDWSPARPLIILVKLLQGHADLGGPCCHPWCCLVPNCSHKPHLSPWPYHSHGLFWCL